MQFINLHTHLFSNTETILEVVNQYPWEFNLDIPQYSVGIHPWYINKNRLKSDLETIANKLELNKCLALGECGLDKRIETPMFFQTEVFQQQLDLVKSIKKPIILHCVAAYQEVIAIKREMNIENSMIIHGFSKNEQLAKSLLDNGFYLSFGKYLLRNPDLEKVFKLIPNDRFFLETDTIGETIFEVYQKAAFIKNISIQNLKEQIASNFNSIFINKK